MYNIVSLQYDLQVEVILQHLRSHLQLLDYQEHMPNQAVHELE